MKNKRGSHISIIISIVAFMSFLIFVYSILGPAIDVDKDRQLAIDSLHSKLIKEFSSNYTVVGFSIPEGYNPGTDYSCLQLIHPANSELNYTVKNIDGEIFSVSSSGELQFYGNGGDEFFKIYYVNGSLDTGTFDSTTCYNASETIEYINKEKKPMESKIKDLIVYYDAEYGDLKEYLNIPFETEFGFNFTYSNGTTIGPEMKINAEELYAQEFAMEYVNGSASLNSGKLNIFVGG